MKCTMGGTVALGAMVAVAVDDTGDGRAGGAVVPVEVRDMVSVEVGARVAEAGTGDEVSVLAMIVCVAGGSVALGPAVTQAANVNPIRPGQSRDPRASIAREMDTWRPAISTRIAV